ncbi:N-acetylglucosaminyl-phosphatidylinositol de-N-acetylase [Nakaseomyces bracarensis]|uniref:N-acetylglucosaminylphosphatidylinositol deacetylase n=1 Tax=Nakaseomyces bracarensis TaxID=273131 RepID=A0ABR4NZ65_9SACH
MEKISTIKLKNNRKKFPFSKVLFKLTKLLLVLQVLYIYVTPKIQAGNRLNLDKVLNVEDGEAGTLNLVIAHPDDEVMFFAPTLIQLLDHVENFNVICFSNGDADGLGELRAQELKKSINYLAVNRENLQNIDVTILDHPDGPKEVWTGLVDDLKKHLKLDNGKNDFILTFDQNGISNHKNHIVCNDAVVEFKRTEAPKRVLYLELESLSMLNIVVKYIGIVPKLIQILYESIRSWNFKPISYLPSKCYSPRDEIITFVSTFDEYALAFAAMAYGHKSQMEWFRYLWWSFSRYVFINDLRPF